MPIASFRQLIVWQRAIDLTFTVYAATNLFPKNEMFGLASQMRRAAVSIPSNTAEGQARATKGEFKQFLGGAWVFGGTAHSTHHCSRAALRDPRSAPRLRPSKPTKSTRGFFPRYLPSIRNAKEVSVME
jgi:hypothetical protein